MSDNIPFLQITGPNGQQLKVDIAEEKVTIGRFEEHNDIALQPDPQQLITRVHHCTIERSEGVWWIVDNGSVNKTFLERDGSVEVVDGKAVIGDLDTVRVLGIITDEGDPLYWEMVFNDPERTQVADIVSQLAFLRYDWIQAKLMRFDGRTRAEIPGLRPQEHKLIRYMDQRNWANGFVPVMCTYEELIQAIWDDDAYGHTEVDINRLVWELRKKIEINQKEPQFLQTVRGMGYRLITKK